MKKNLTACAVLFLILLFNLSCSSIEKIEGKDKAETYFLRGEAYLKEGMYEKALEKFSLVKNKFPYSPYAVESELKVADTYYEKGDYIEAQRVYNMFGELHPKHEKRDYAVYKSGMSYYKLLPSTIDRDLSVATKALQDFKTIMETYPNSPYFKDALLKYTDCRTRMGEKEFYIGEFYRKRDKYYSAVPRFLNIIENYSSLGFEEKTYYKLAYCYKKMDEKEKSKVYIQKLVSEFPNGKYTSEAKRLYKD